MVKGKSEKIREICVTKNKIKHSNPQSEIICGICGTKKIKHSNPQSEKSVESMEKKQNQTQQFTI